VLLDPEQKNRETAAGSTRAPAAHLHPARQIGSDGAWPSRSPFSCPSRGGPPRFDSNRAWEHLRQLGRIGARPAGSVAIEQSRKYIKDQLARRGRAVTEQRGRSDADRSGAHGEPDGRTIPGASKGRLVIGGHYDTKKFHRVQVRRANDGGSSAAFLLELARD